MSNWFDISNEGWRRMNAGRPPHELVKELVQNVLDEEFKTVRIDFGVNNGVFDLVIEDDVVNGISNSSLITTVFLTGKEDSCLKRGRKGRGLKEFLSVCNTAEVETVGKTISFLADGSRSEESNNRTIGTKISCKIVEAGWDESAVTAIESYLKKIIINTDSEIFVNGKKVAKKVSLKSFLCELETHIIENGVQVTTRRSTYVYLYPKKTKGWIYEMGIPVVETDIPYDVDIGQRIPMNDNRNEVNEYYIDNIKRGIIINFIDMLSKKDLIGWAVRGLRGYSLESRIEDKIIEKIGGDSVLDFVVKSNNKFDDKAKQRGKKLIDIREMDYYLQDVFTHRLKKAEDYVVSMEREIQPVECIPNEEEVNFLSVHKGIIEAIGLNVELRIVTKEKDSSGFFPVAFYTDENGHVISYNKLAMKFKDPYNEYALDTLIHELGHTEEACHDKMEYVDAVTKFGAKICRYLMKFPVKVTVKTAVKREKTVVESIKDLLQGGYLTLEEIYIGMGAETVGAKAGIRGALNRNCSETGMFERYADGGKYKLRG